MNLAGARVLLMGTARHDKRSGLPDVPAVPDTLADLRTALIDQCGVSPAGVKVLLDPDSPLEMGDAVASAAEAAEDILLVYYVGHGLVSPTGSLYLATARTDWQSTRGTHTALAYDTVRDYLLDCTSSSVIVILDCCFSGRALNALGESDEQLATLAAVEGGFVLTSAGRNKVALAPPGQRHTAFTGALLRLLEQGDPDGPPEITLHDTYRYLARSLPAAGYPRPQYQSMGTAGDLVLAPNNAYHRSVPAAVTPEEDADPTPWDPAAELPSTADSGYRRRSPRASLLVTGAVVLTILAVVGALVMPSLRDANPNGSPGGNTAPCRIRVTSDTLRVRAAPDVNAETVRTLSVGTVLDASKEVQNKYRKIAENQWVSTDFVTPLGGTDCG